MIKRFIKTVLISLMLMSGLSLAVVPQTAIAQSKEDVCKGVGLATGGTGCDTPDGSPSVQSTIKKVINLLSVVVGIIAVIMVIIGGMKYVLSSGDSKQVNSAKDTILFALVGIVIVALAQFIVKFVLDKAVTPII